MAPRETPKTRSKIQRPILENTIAKAPKVSKQNENITTKNMTKNIPLKEYNLSGESSQRTKTNHISTPKSKKNKSTQLPGTVTSSIKKATCKRRPKPAHSGVPVPEKMKKLLAEKLQCCDVLLY